VAGAGPGFFSGDDFSDCVDKASEHDDIFVIDYIGIFLTEVAAVIVLCHWLVFSS